MGEELGNIRSPELTNLVMGEELGNIRSPERSPELQTIHLRAKGIQHGRYTEGTRAAAPQKRARRPRGGQK